MTKASNIVIVLALSAVISVPLHAQVTSTWQGGSSGSFNGPLNWDEGVPGGDDIARFTDAGAVVVTFSAGANVLNLQYEGTQSVGPPVVDPRLTFELGEFTFALNQATSFNYSGSGTMTFVQNGGTLTSTSTLGMAWPANSGAGSRSVYLLENGATFDVGGSAVMGYASGATGEMHVTQGSSATSRSSTWVARNGAGVLSVRGEDSLFTATTGNTSHHFSIGHSGGNGHLEVLDGGSLSSTPVINLAQGTSSATFLVSGSGSNVTGTRQLYVGGYAAGYTSTPTAGGTATATFADGATASFSAIRTFVGNAELGRLGTLVFDQSGGVTASDVTFDPGSVVRFVLYEKDQIVDLTATSNLVINGSFLEAMIAPLYEPVIGDSFALISYGPLDPGTFANENGQVVIGDAVFQIDYNLNDANVIGLTMIPEPGAGALALGVLVSLLAVLYRRWLRQ